MSVYGCGGLRVWRFTGAYVFQSSLGEKRRPTGDLAPWASWCWWEGQTLVNSMAGNDLRNNATKQCSMFSGFYCFVLRKVPNAFARSTYPRSPHIPLPHTLAWPPAWAGEGFARKNEKTQIPSHEISKSDIAYSLVNRMKQFQAKLSNRSVISCLQSCSTIYKVGHI